MRISTPLAAILLAIGLSAVAAEPPAKPPSKEQIAVWIKGLGSDSFEEREQASKALWKAGQAAEAALRQVLKDGDAEAVRRAKEILDKFDAGIYPDTPEAVVRLIEEYRGAAPQNRPATISKLLEQGGAGYTAFMKLVAQEKDEAAKAVIWQTLADEMPRLAAALLADGQDTRLEQILEQSLRGEGDAPYANYAAYLLVRGKLDDKIRQWQKKAGAAPDKKTALTLAYLCRAKGDLPAARRYAEKADGAGGAFLLQSILVEQQDWKALLEVPPAPANAPPNTGGPGWRLALLRLSGDRDGFEAELTKARAPDAPLSLSSFLLNGRPDDGLKDQISKGLPVAELLAARQRYRQALEELDKPAAPARSAANGLYQSALLVRLGEWKRAREVIDSLSTNMDGTLLIIMTLANSSHKDDAFAKAAEVLGKVGDGEETGLLNVLFQSADLVSVDPWWKLLRGKYPNDDKAASLKRLRDLLGRKLPAADVAALIKDLTDEAANLKDDERELWLHCAVDTCRTLGRDDLLEGCLQKWAAGGGGRFAWIGLGDLSASKKRWKEAAQRYRKAWELDHTSALALYLHGRALVQAGDGKEGRRWMAIAEIIPLSIEAYQSDLAMGLAERGLDEAAAKAWQRMEQVGLFISAIDGWIDRALAEKAIADKDYLKAANYFRREALHELWEPRIYDVDSELWLAIAEHRCRARAQAVAGRLDDMRKEVETVLALQPGNIDLAIDLVPELAKRGRKKDADELFSRIYAVQDSFCKEYPKSAWSHNNTAWLAVRCRRDLDAALEHAKKGVELEPDNAGHLDTLAEVYFQRGDKDKAIDLEKKCLAMEPRNLYFRRQVKRMQAGDRDSDVPPEPTPGSAFRTLMLGQ